MPIYISDLGELPSDVYERLPDNFFYKTAEGKTCFGNRSFSRPHRAYFIKATEVATHTKEEWIEMVLFFNTVCCKCECEVIGKPTKDHIIPLYFGGSNSIRNIQPLCRQCNISKMRDAIDYRYDYCERNDLVLPVKWRF